MKNRLILRLIVPVMKSIFDSSSEEKVFERLKTYWGRYVNIFPQLSPVNIFGYDQINSMDESDKIKQFLLKTSFDFVICDLVTHEPMLVVEFDGMSGGFSSEGKYYSKSTPATDPYRQLKMQTKIRICEHFRIPIIVVSYEECSLLKESEEMINVLDAIIGASMERANFDKNYSTYIDMLTEAYEFGGNESAEMASIEIDCINEMSNPIKRKIKEITKNFPIWPYQILFRNPDDAGYLKGRFKLNAGYKCEDGKSHLFKTLISVDISIRPAETFADESFFLFNTIGEYCLARKTEKILGSDRSKWRDRIANTPWTHD
jgi:hypothetical protein